MPKSTKETDSKIVNTQKHTTSKTSTSKSTVSKKIIEKKKNSKSAVSSKKPSKNTSSNLKNTNKKTSTSKSKKTEIVEYYDLPYRYNKTIVKILAQTPNTLFVYWDIADSDRKKYEKDFGENFFSATIPVLIVHNITKNYSFEIEINDFANCWYFTVADSKCNYEIELGRKPKENNIHIDNNYMHITSSNVVESPNNHILFEKKQKTLFFRNVKSNENYTKDISEFEFIKYVGRIYNTYDVYQKIYKTEELQDIIKNPSSGF